MDAVATSLNVFPLTGFGSARSGRDASSQASSSHSVCLRRRPDSFWGANVDLSSSLPTRRSSPSASSSTSSSPLKIEMAISRAKKELTIERVNKELVDCKLIASLNYKRFTVKQFQDLRKSLPPGVTLLVCKNKLLGKAIENTPFQALSPAMKGMNAFLFVKTEEVPPALKPYRDMQKEQKLEENDFRGAVFEGKFYGPEDFKSLETMPSRLEIYAKLLGIIKGPSSSLVATLKAPSVNLVMTLKAYVAKLEEEAGAPAA
eukprot:TRINITY_DN32495_c0_g1_i1.p1 TRINITY_DN32495_c0_g1~~TRINITY_DN32495_c0_g1_i1.p1  ORF type:complete len:260 (-),score=70.14 TRINITY_DN32495_c0_g1_i1:550-1329(-)